MSKRFLYGAIDLVQFQALAIGTNETKIDAFISGKADKAIKHFKVIIESGKDYKVKLNIEDFSPARTNFEEVAFKMRKLWELIYLFESDVSESNTEIYIFE
jgi:hypothetical protein